MADWPTLGPGVFFGQQRGWPDQAARDAAAAARRAAGGGGRGDARPTTPPIYGQGISGIAIDENDHIYVFNRGEQTVMVFDREGDLVRAGAERDMHGAPVAGGWAALGRGRLGRQRVGGRAHEPPHPQVRPDVGTSADADRHDRRARERRHHLNSPSGILFTREGNIVVTDGYGNNRVALYGPDGTFIKQVAKGWGGPEDKGAGPGEWDLPHQGAVDADDNLYLIDRENRRVQMFDNQLNYVREFANEGWNPWDIAISRRGDDGVAYIADHAGERVHKIALDDGRILATWGEPGRGPGQFDWVHGMAVDTREPSTRPTPTASACRSSCRSRPSDRGGRNRRLREHLHRVAGLDLRRRTVVLDDSGRGLHAAEERADPGDVGRGGRRCDSLAVGR